MADPTTAEIESLRRETGDTTEPILVGYHTIVNLWERASGDSGIAAVYMLRQMLTALTNATPCMGDVKARREALTALLTIREKEAGVRGRLRTGSIGLNLHDSD